MDINSLIVAVLLSLGLIGTDAVINAGTISFDVQVTEDLTKKGYTPQLVDSMLDSYLREFVEFKSLAHPPQIRSAQDESVVSAIAASLNLKGVTQSFQSDFGLNPIRITGSLMAAPAGNGEFRFILSGTSTHTGVFIIDETSGSKTLPEFTESIAETIVARLEPYAAAIHKFDEMAHNLITHNPQSGHAQLVAFIEAEMNSEAGQADSDVDHALFHNLLGIAAMMSNKPDDAEMAFRMAQSLNPNSGIPALNLAVQYLSQQRFDDALKLVAAASRQHDVRSIPYVWANAETIEGLALWGKQDLPGAAAAFLDSVKSYPGSLWGYYYWAKLLDSVGNTKDADLLRVRAQANLRTFETYPELCLLHVVVLPDRNFSFRPVDLTRMKHITELAAQVTAQTTTQ